MTQQELQTTKEQLEQQKSTAEEARRAAAQRMQARLPLHAQDLSSWNATVLRCLHVQACTEQNVSMLLVSLCWLYMRHGAAMRCRQGIIICFEALLASRQATLAGAWGGACGGYGGTERAGGAQRGLGAAGSGHPRPVRS